MQDKTIDSVLRHLHKEAMNGRHGGLVFIVALMRIRGVKPSFKRKSDKLGPRAEHRRVRLVKK